MRVMPILILLSAVLFFLYIGEVTIVEDVRGHVFTFHLDSIGHVHDAYGPPWGYPQMFEQTNESKQRNASHPAE